MAVELSLAVLLCLNRTELDYMQSHSRYLRDLIVRNARTMPLRRIRSIRVRNRQVCIRAAHDCRDLRISGEGERNLEELVRRVNNSFVGRLEICSRNLGETFLVRMRDSGPDLQCHVRFLRVSHASRCRVDHATIEFVGRCLRPKVYATRMDSEDQEESAMLFTHDAMRHTVSRLSCRVYAVPAPLCIIPGLLHVGVLETFDVTLGTDPRPWIAQFVKAFRELDLGTNTVRGGTLLFVRYGFETPLRRIADDPFEQTPGVDVPTPKDAFVEKWCRSTRTGRVRVVRESPCAKLFTYASVKASKQLNVFVWTVQDVRALHYVYVLQAIDV